MIEIGEYIYSDDTERRLTRSVSRGMESMLSERLKINYLQINILNNINNEYEVSILKWVNYYSKDEFNAGPEIFVERVILDYTFGADK
jgi:hypothetical protein